MNKNGTERQILMLQGPASFFFSALARALRACGAEVHKIHLCPGDRLFWRGGGAVAFRGRPADWVDFLIPHAASRKITDLVCLGDGRSWHSAAIRALRPLGIRIHVVEQGYLRPHWLTIEPDGTGGNSRFPKDPARITRLANENEAPAAPDFRTSFAAYAAMDVAYNLSNVMVGPLFYPHYRTHALDSPWREWTGWIGKALRRPRRRRVLSKAELRLASHAGAFYLLPLQLETDFQIRMHGPNEGMRGILRKVIVSFARNAPPDMVLVVKVHPLDNGWTPWQGLLAEFSQEAGIADRTIFFDGGDLSALLDRATGVVTVNSTVGLSAIQAGVPVMALGKAIYNIPGLCHQGGLDEFWNADASVDTIRLNALVTALAATIQVPGGFDGEGVQPGADAMAERILAPRLQVDAAHLP